MMSATKQISLALSLLFLLATACSKNDKLPANVLSVGKMSAIMLDLQLAQSYNYSFFPEFDSTYPSDRKKRLKMFYHQIFQLHQTDTATFFSSFRYYSSHPVWLKKVYGSMQDSLDRKLARQTQWEKKRREATSARTKAGKAVVTAWSRYFKTWHAFSDSIHQQVSRRNYPLIP